MAFSAVLCLKNRRPALCERVLHYPGLSWIMYNEAMELQTFIFIDTAVTFYNRQRPHVIYLNISRDTSKIRMMARRRMDDINEEEIERRLNWFESDVLPAVEYFRKYSKYNFIELDGDQPVEAVQQKLLWKVFANSD